MSRSSYQFNQVFLPDVATIVGQMEGAGPLASHFDLIEADPYFGMKSWEQAEMQMVKLAIEKILSKSNKTITQLDVAFGGDLVNQLVPTHYAMRNFDIPFVGVYSACACVIEALILAGTFVENNLAKQALVFASSHNNMAEKQFRMPVEYGGPKSETAQYTATGAGVGIVASIPAVVKVESATIGIIVDAKQNNPSDMGAAMAPAAAHTIKRHFNELNLQPDYYDLIVTGDLAAVGSPILLDLLKTDGFDIAHLHQDGGMLLYDEIQQPTFAGGSGAGCISIVMFSYIMNLLVTKQVNRVLVVGTGALLNPLIVAQKETIPGIAHAVALVRGDE